MSSVAPRKRTACHWYQETIVVALSLREIFLWAPLSMCHTISQSPWAMLIISSVLDPVSTERSGPPRALHRWTGLLWRLVGHIDLHELNLARPYYQGPCPHFRQKMRRAVQVNADGSASHSAFYRLSYRQLSGNVIGLIRWRQDDVPSGHAGGSPRLSLTFVGFWVGKRPGRRGFMQTHKSLACNDTRTSLVSTTRD